MFNRRNNHAWHTAKVRGVVAEYFLFILFDKCMSTLVTVLIASIGHHIRQTARWPLSPPQLTRPGVRRTTIRAAQAQSLALLKAQL